MDIWAPSSGMIYPQFMFAKQAITSADTFITGLQKKQLKICHFLA
jgi:hypothetical protein